MENPNVEKGFTRSNFQRFSAKLCIFTIMHFPLFLQKHALPLLHDNIKISRHIQISVSLGLNLTFRVFCEYEPN